MILDRAGWNQFLGWATAVLIHKHKKKKNLQEKVTINVHLISFAEEQNIGKNIDIIIKKSVILNEALNENCSIDKLNKSNCIRRIQKAMCTIYQDKIALHKCVLTNYFEVSIMNAV